MKKVLFILPLLLISIVSCSNSYITPACVSVYTSSISKDHNKDCHYLRIYEIYEKISGSNNWSNPRFDREIEFYYDEEITLKNLEYSFISTLNNDSYSLQVVLYDYANLDSKVPDNFYITENTKIYYGYRLNF